MGSAIVFLVLAMIIAFVLLVVVALPHLRRTREGAASSRHTSRTTRVES